VTGLQLPLISAGGTSTATTLLVLGIVTSAARHEPEAVAALRAGREDRVNRFLRLPLPEPYVMTRLDAARDRLRTRSSKPKTKSKTKPDPKRKPAPKAKPKSDRRRTGQGADEPTRRTGHHGGRQRQPSPRARALEGQRYG
jgi:cell division protein FtsW